MKLKTIGECIHAHCQYLRVIDCKREISAAEKKEDYGKIHQTNKRTTPMKSYLHNNKEQESNDEEVHWQCCHLLLSSSK